MQEENIGSTLKDTAVGKGSEHKTHLPSNYSQQLINGTLYKLGSSIQQKKQFYKEEAHEMGKTPASYTSNR